MNWLELILIRPVELLLAVLFTFFEEVTGSYGLSLILLSLAVTLITAPLYFLAEKWKKEEQTIRARMARDLKSIKTHYTGQKRYYLTRALHRLHGYRSIYSLRTSFGLFVQIPFFFGAYRYLSGFQGYLGESFLFIPDLGRPDALLWGVHALPILMTAVNVLSSLLYTRTRPIRENVQLLALAALFLIVLYDRPAGLLIYWTMNNVFSLLKNALFERPDPATTAETPGLSTAVAILLRKTGRPENRSVLLSGALLLLVSAQTYWLNRFDETFKYGILLTGILASALSVVFLAQYLQHRRIHSGRSVLIWFFSVWLLFGVVAYLLLFERRQNAYLSNANIKVVTVLVQDVIIFMTSRWLMTRRRDGGTGSEGEGDAGVRQEGSRRSLFILASVFLTTYVFVLSPMLIYFSSPADVGMGLGALLARNTPGVLVLSAFLILLYRVHRLFRSRALELVLTAITVMLVYNYLVPGNYGIVDEFRLERDHLLDQIGLFHHLLDILIIGGAYLLVSSLLRRGTGLLGGVLVAVMVAFGLQVGVTALRTERVAFSSVDPTMSAQLPRGSERIHSFSKTGVNVVFFVADMFNGNYMGRLLEESPEYADLLDGFTWYPNTLSISSHSATSLPALLGGWRYAPQMMNGMPGTGAEKLAEAAGGFYDAVLEREWEIGLVDPLYLDPEQMDRDYGNRLWKSSASEFVGYWLDATGQNPAGVDRILKNRLLVMTTVFQSAPYMLKARIYDDGSWIIFRKSYQFDYIARKTTRSYAHLDLLPQISNTNNTRSSVKFIHTQLTHEPYGVTRQGTIIDQEFPDPKTRSFTDSTSAYHSARRFMDFLVEWIRWMKTEGVYDNTSFVITADHGNNTMDNGLHLPAGLNTLTNRHQLARANVLLLTKDGGETGPLIVDPRPMSNADAAALVLAAPGDTGGREGQSVAVDRDRPTARSYAFLLGDWRDFLENESATYSTYTVRGDLRSPASWSK